MPVTIDELGEHEGSIPIRPGTNEETLLRELATHGDLAYTPQELVEATDVGSGSVHKTLARLVSKGLVQRTERGYYHAATKRNVERLISSIQALERIHRNNEGDWFDRNPEWADDMPDLGKVSIDARIPGSSADEPIDTDDLPDLGKEQNEERE